MTLRGTHLAKSSMAGFTLLEMLVVALLMSLIGTLALGGFRMGNQVWARTHESTNDLREVIAVQSFLARLLEASQPIIIRDGSRTPPVYFEGTADRLRFIAPLPAHLGSSDLQILELSVRSDPGGQTFVLRWSPLGTVRPDVALITPEQEETLAKTLESVSFSYGDGREDYASWSAQATLPRTVGLRVVRADGTQWPPLVVGLPMAVDW